MVTNKRLLFSLSILILIALITSNHSFGSELDLNQHLQAEQSTNLPDELTLYNSKWGIQMQYPSSWEIIESSSIEIKLQPSDIMDEEHVMLIISDDDLDFPSLAEYASTQRATITTYNTMADNIEQLESETIGNKYDAYYVLYSSEFFVGFEEYVVTGDKGYTFDYSADTNLYDQYLSDVEDMLQSVEFFQPEDTENGESKYTPLDLPTFCRKTPGGSFEICYNQ